MPSFDQSPHDPPGVIGLLTPAPPGGAGSRAAGPEEPGCDAGAESAGGKKVSSLHWEAAYLISCDHEAARRRGSGGHDHNGNSHYDHPPSCPSNRKNWLPRQRFSSKEDFLNYTKKFWFCQ